jgi:hypothetical protein
VEPSADDVEDERATFIRTAAAAEQAQDEQSDDAAARAFYGIDEKK